MSEKNKIPKETIASFLSQNTCFDVTANDLKLLQAFWKNLIKAV